MSSGVETSLIVNSKRFLDFARNDKWALALQGAAVWKPPFVGGTARISRP
jgi:hypothetical protein